MRTFLIVIWTSRLKNTKIFPTSLSVCRFSLYNPQKISSLVVRIKQMIILSNLKMKNKFLPTCLRENYRGSLGEFSNTSYACVFGTNLRLRLRIEGITAVNLENGWLRTANKYRERSVQFHI